MMTEAQAIRKIQRDAATENEPRVSEQDVADILAEHARASVRQNTSVYGVGDKVVLNPFNGRLYECITAGISGAASPVSYATERGAVIADGSVRWKDWGAAYDEVWDIRAATAAVWRHKAALDSQAIDVSDKDTKILLTQRRDYALTMAKTYGGGMSVV